MLQTVLDVMCVICCAQEPRASRDQRGKQVLHALLGSSGQQHAAQHAGAGWGHGGGQGWGSGR